MNAKLFFSCLMITFGMIFWMFFQPGSLMFIGIRTGIAFISIIIAIFSLNWYQKKQWKKTLLIISFVLLFASAIYFAFTWGMATDPILTLSIILALVILILIYIKYIEPKVLKNLKPGNSTKGIRPEQLN